MTKMVDDGDYNQPNKNWLEGYVYVLDYGDNKTFKIGYTTVNPNKRLSMITAGLPVIMPQVALVMSVYTHTNSRYLEQLLHMKHDAVHVKGEWFALNFTDLVEMYVLFGNLGVATLYDRWYELVPEDAPLAAKQGLLDWTRILPFFTKDEEKEASSFDFLLSSGGNNE